MPSGLEGIITQKLDVSVSMYYVRKIMSVRAVFQGSATDLFSGPKDSGNDDAIDELVKVNSRAIATARTRKTRGRRGGPGQRIAEERVILEEVSMAAGGRRLRDDPRVVTTMIHRRRSRG